MASSKPILSLVKQIIPKPVVDGIDLCYAAVDSLLITSYQKWNAWNKPIPPFHLRKITAKRSVTNFVQSGKRISLYSFERKSSI